jgi:hypothetical protein
MTLRGPAELVAAIPHLLGFHPKQSLVFVWLTMDRIVLTQRVDAAALDHLLANPDVLIEPARRVESTDVLVTSFPAGDNPEEARLQAFVPTLAAHGVSVLDVLVIGPDGWRSVVCREDCCAEGPRFIDIGVRDRVAADFVLDGVAVLADRDQLIDEVARDCVLVSKVAGGWQADPDYPSLVRRCQRRWQRTDGRVRTRDLVSHLVALDNVVARDALVWHLAHLDHTRLRHTGELLRTALRAAPDQHVAPIATLAGIAAWLAGDGARALVALDRGLADDPNYVLAGMVQAAIGAGLPPSQWRHMVRQVPLEQICPHAFRGNPL